jgi:parallel beta-helix repeat protein
MDGPCSTTLSPGADAASNHAAIQAALSNAKPGDVVCLSDGTYPLKEPLSLAVDRVEVRGVPDGQPVLDFAGEATGASGLVVNGAKDTRLTQFTVKNTGGDAILGMQVTGITFTSMTVSWDAGPMVGNGAHGLSAVQSTRVLVDAAKVSGASAAGIYIGRSSQILVRGSEAFDNLAGVELENSSDAEVAGSHLHDNVAGVLVLALPDEPVEGAARINVHDNRVEKNDGSNLAGPSGILHLVPSGSGVLVMAASDNEVHGNTIQDNDSFGVAVLSYDLTQLKVTDPSYDPYSHGNYTHDNTFAGNGQYPSGIAGTIAAAVNQSTVQDTLWDGREDAAKPNTDGSRTNCFHADGAATFIDLGLDDTLNFHPSTDANRFDCMHVPLPPIAL